jgi:hypothetical protein
MSDPMLTQIEVGPTDAAETTMPGVAQVSTEICCPQCSPSDPDTSGEPAQFASTTSPSSRKAPAFRASPPPVPSTGQGSSSQQWSPTQPKRLLHLFSGPANRIDGLRSMMLELYSIDVIEFDTLIGNECDLTDDVAFSDLLARAQAGEFFAALIGTPCSTFSVARIAKPGFDDDGPPQARSLEHLHGVPGIPDWCKRQVELSDLLVERSVAIARAVHDSGGEFVIENPVARSDPITEHYRWKWRSHAALWSLPLLKALRKERWTRSVTFPQCALGGAFQKWTTLLYSVGLEPSLRSLGELRCDHARHPRQASGLEDGKWKSADAAAYPAEMNALLAHAFARLLRRPGLVVGSKRPHASLLPLSEAARPTPHHLPHSVSAGGIRRLEPETQEALRAEPMPAANVAPTTSAPDPPQPERDAPPPRTTDELISAPMQTRLRDFRVQVGACFEAARRGRWKWARDHRPPPLYATEEECLLPGARGWIWAYSLTDKLWHCVQPSRWPDDPPTGELETAVIVQYAAEHGYCDEEIITFMANGYPAPEMERATLLGPPHVGALKEMEAFEKMAAKDRERGWVRYGYALPPLWPMRADPMNIVFRHGKPRMTIDKSMQLIAGVPAYNDCVDLEAQPSIEYVSVAMLGRACAILLTSGLRVRTWGFDLEAYFRKTGKQRRDVWKSGFVHPDGYGADERVQFGQREAPVLTGRQSCFCVWAIRRELHRLDREYPPTHPGLCAWLLERRELVAPLSSQWWQADVLSFVLMFVDDVGGTSVDDDLSRADGTAVFVIVEGARVRRTRAAMHYEAAIGVIVSFGHKDADGKGVPPDADMVYLGVTVDVDRLLMSLSNDKCTSYRASVDALVRGRTVGSLVVVPADDLSSTIHKLLHASSVIPLGRQHLFAVMRAARTITRLESGAKALSAAAIRELGWWSAMLARQVGERGVPLAARFTFPEPTEPGVLAPYSDASREIGSPGASGFGAWAIVKGDFVYVEGRWSDREVGELDINTLELAAMDIGTFTFADYSESVGVGVTHFYEFTDNTSAEYSTERGKPRAGRLGALIERRYSAMARMNVFGTAERVATEDNDVADGISRGGTMLADALRIPASLGYKIVRLEPLAEWRDTSGLFDVDA